MEKYKSTVNVSLFRPKPGNLAYNEVISEGLLEKDTLNFESFLSVIEKFDNSHPHVRTKYLTVEEVGEWHKKMLSATCQRNVKKNLFSRLFKWGCHETR